MKLEVSNIIFLISLTILTGYLTFLTTKGGLTNNRQNNIWKKLTLRGKTVFFTLLSMLIILVFQEINSQNSNFNKTYQIKQEQSYRDSIVAVGIRNGIDSSNAKLFGELSIAFASQNLKIDTLNNTVSILTDSIKTSIINNFESLDPVIWIDTAGIKYEDKINNEVFLQFRCSDAGASQIRIRAKLLIELYDKTFKVEDFNVFPDNLILAKDTKWNTSITLNSSYKVKIIYFHFIGTYRTLDSKKEFNIDYIFSYDNATKKAVIVGNNIRIEVLKVMYKK